MSQKMRLLSLIVLIAFTLLPLFKVVHISYADHHPPTREEHEELKQEQEELKEENEDLREKVEELEEQLEDPEGDTDRGIVDSLVDIGKFTISSCVAAVGLTGVVCATTSGAVTFGLSAPISIPAGVISTGAFIGGAATAWSASNNLVNDVVDLFSDDDDNPNDD